jgi:hypothetical protein
MSTRLLTILGDVGEFSKPILDDVLADYEFTWSVNCLNCKESRELKIIGTFRNQVYVQSDEAREIAVLQLENARLIQCGNCNCLYHLVQPEPVYRRVFDINEKSPIEPQLTREYNHENMEADIRRSRDKITLSMMEVPERF